MIYTQQRLPEVEQAIEKLLSGAPVAAARVLRGEAQAPVYRLLAADVFVLDEAELWYELLVAAHHQDDQHLSFLLRVVSESAQPAGKQFNVHFGVYRHELSLNENGEAAWTLPVDQVLERRTRRIRRPIMLSVAEE